MRSFRLLVLFLALAACNTDPKPSTSIDFIILQMNDVYEIGPLEGGAVAGLARVATLRNQLLEENPNVVTVLSGDFLSPSLIGTLKQEGELIAGSQMVETLNALGLDYVTFGNHEFDLKEADCLKRIAEAEFTFTVANVQHRVDSATVVPFEQFGKPVPEYVLHPIEGPDGQKIRLGLIGVCLPFNKTGYVEYEDVTTTFNEQVAAIRDSCEVLVGITHLEMVDDLELAAQLDDVPLLLGGHDHVNMIDTGGSCVVTKADANAKTVYVHRVSYDPNTKKSTIQSELVSIDSSIEYDPTVDAVVQKWLNHSNSIMQTMGYQPDEVIFTATDPLEGRESHIRNEQTNLGSLINASQLAYLQADAALMNSGSIRVDDVLEGPITQYDILRTLPFGGAVGTAEFTGALLIKTLDIGLETNRGIGGYLQIANIFKDEDEWMVNNEPIDPAKTYTIAAPGFLLSGGEANLEFLADLTAVFPEEINGLENDLRHLVISYGKTLDTQAAE